MKSLAEVQTAILIVIDFIEKYSQIGDVHMVDYFTKDHWNTLLSPSCKNELLHKDEEALYRIASVVTENNDKRIEPQNAGAHSEEGFVVRCLETYTSAACSCRLPALNILTPLQELENELNSVATVSNNFKQVDSKEYMSKKKAHEVEEMSSVIYMLSRHCKTKQILDIGSGKGYLSSHLSLKFNLQVTAIDCNAENTSNASKRAEKYLSYWKKYLNCQKRNAASPKVNNESLQLKTVTSYVAPATDLNTLLCEDTLPDVSECQCVVTGLHTCGDLCSTVISMFIANKAICGMCVVGCCYHHITESSASFPLSNFLKRKCFSLGRNKRMLGLKSLERNATIDVSMQREKSERSLFYRAILSVILQEKYQIQSDNKDFCVGKIFSKSYSFVDYVHRCLHKLKLDNGILNDADIEKYLQSYQHRFKEIIAFSMIRHLYGPAVESIIVLDRYLHLLEQANCSEVAHCVVCELFDPVISPRCYAFVGWR